MKKKSPKKSLVKSVVEKISAAKAARDEPPPPWIKYVAMLTGILAGLAGFLTVRATTVTNTAIYESNQAILAQSESSDAWAEYQADSIKAHVTEIQLRTAIALDPPVRRALEDEAKKFRDRQPISRQEAQAKAAARDGYLAQGRKYLQTRDLLSYANLAAQLGIALASVAAMVRMRRAFDAAVFAGLAALAIAGYALGAQYFFAAP